MAPLVRRSIVWAGALAVATVLWGCRIEEDAVAADLGGADAPSFELEDLDGGSVALEDLRGSAVVVDFWATWCAPCVFQIPVLNAFHERYGDRVAVIGVSVDAGGREVVEPFAHEHGITYPILLGDEGLAQQYGALGFPALFVLTPDGKIDSAHVGIVEAADLEAAVSEALGGPGRL